MRLDFLNEFVTFSKCLNYSKAAEQLFLTQPVLSRHISDLEKQLGVQLVIRNTRKVELTEMGRIFAIGAQKLLDNYEELMQQIQTATSGITGRLSIGFLHYAVNDLLSQFIIYFTNLYPKIRLEYYAEEIHDLVNKLETNQIDLGFAPSIYNTATSHLRIKPVFHDKLCVLLPINHPLCLKEEITIKDLSGQPLVEFSKSINPWTYAHHQSIFDAHQSEYRIAVEAPNISTSLFYVSINKGILIIPEHLATLRRGNMVSKRICDEDVGFDINIICKRDNPNPIINIFFDSFNQYYSV